MARIELVVEVMVEKPDSSRLQLNGVNVSNCFSFRQVGPNSCSCSLC